MVLVEVRGWGDLVCSHKFLVLVDKVRGATGEVHRELVQVHLQYATVHSHSHLAGVGGRGGEGGEGMNLMRLGEV